MNKNIDQEALKIVDYNKDVFDAIFPQYASENNLAAKIERNKKIVMKAIYDSIMIEENKMEWSQDCFGSNIGGEIE